MRPSATRSVVCIAVALSLATTAGMAGGDVAAATATPTRSAGTGVTTSTALGADLTQVSADPWRNPVADASARSVLARSARYVEQPLMGWGVGNPEPSPGHYDWQSLASRLRFIASTGATPVITLAGAPDWMKGGNAGTTDWRDINEAPLPQYYGAFARLAVAVARRFPQVHYFQVWSELKGFWDPTTNNWDVAAYTSLYNDVYRALKAADPHAEVGGPYVDMVTWGSPTAGGYPSDLRGPWGTVDQRSLDVVTYWLTHADGADFLAVDGGIDPKGGPLPADPGAATAMFAAVDDWLRVRTTLPIWWSEWYVGMPTIRSHPRVWLAVAAAALVQMTTSGAAVALVWDPQRYPGSHSPGLWTSTNSAGGGKATELARVFALIKAGFPPGRRATLWGTAGVQLLRARAASLAVNASGSARTLGPDGHRVHLGPWQVIADPAG